MAVTASARQTGRVAKPRPKRRPDKKSGSLRKTAQDKSRDATGDNGTMTELAKPMTEDERRSASDKTEELIKQRNEVDQALLREAERDVADLKPSDWVPREDLLRRNTTLAERERKHIRARTKTLKEKENLYSSDPSAERAADRDLVKFLLRKFKRHLGTYLEDRERPRQPGEISEDDEEDGSISCVSFDFDSEEDIEDGQEDAVSTSTSDDETSEEEEDSEQSDPDPDDKDSAIGLDGCADDWITEQDRKKKRKRANGLLDSVKPAKEQRKEVKKEQPASKDTSASQQSSVKKEAPGPFPSPPTETGSPPNNAADDSMPQSNKKKLKVNGISSGDPTETASEMKGVSASSLEPWYKIHARAMMQPDFNDHVHYRLNKKRNRMPPREYSVSGALVGPEGYTQKFNGYSTPPLIPNASRLSNNGRRSNGNKFGRGGKKPFPKSRNKSRSPGHRFR